MLVSMIVREKWRVGEVLAAARPVLITATSTQTFLVQSQERQIRLLPCATQYPPSDNPKPRLMSKARHDVRT